MWGSLLASMASLLPRLRFAGTRAMSTIPEISVHPQQAVHALSLSSPSALVTHHQTRSGAEVVEPQGGEDAQSFWIAASRLITWSKPPTVAYGSQGTNSKVRACCERFSGIQANWAPSRRLPGFPMASSTPPGTASTAMCSLDMEPGLLSTTTALSLKPEQLQRVR